MPGTGEDRGMSNEWRNNRQNRQIELSGKTSGIEQQVGADYL
jgi:hypothetical protein